MNRTTALAAILTFFIFFFNCDRPDGPSIPAGFDRETFDDVVEYTLENYIDPKFDTEASYIAATEEALRSLPHPLLIYPVDFYEKRAEVLAPERLVPGKKIQVEGKPYIIFEPDYETFEDIRDAHDEKMKKLRKELSEEARRELAREIRDTLDQEKKVLDESWKKVTFTRQDFLQIVSWIEANYSSYLEVPDVEGRDTSMYEEDPFGMHYVYFAAANGFLHGLDPHSSLIDRSTWDKIKRESEDSTFEGIGALLRGGGQQDVIVETPLPGSPALKAGLRAGDIIRKVDGEPIANLPLSDVVKKIRGPKDTEVVLQVERAVNLETLDIEIIRGVIEQKAVSSKLLPDDELKGYTDKKIGVIKLASFLFDNTYPSEAIEDEYENLLGRAGGSLDGLVLDLRGNPGGDLREAIRVAGLFLPKGYEVVEIRGREKRRAEPNRRKPILLSSAKTPLVILVDAGSASASEIVSSAIMDHNYGLILGDRTFGKATVQSLSELPGVIIKLTTARYYAPKGYTVQVHGVQPDLRISDEPDGSFPLRFREEDMWLHLPELTQRPPDPLRDAWVNRLQTMVGENEKAEKYIKEHTNDALKPDALLIRALAYIDAMRTHPRP